MPKRLTTEEFIERAKRIHGDRYDYSKVVYKKAVELVTIICPEHGEFYQSPMVHLRGNGCRQCGIKKALKAKVMTTDEFIKRAISIHGTKYDYSQVIYKNNSTPVIIICKRHGRFEQRPDVHLRGGGCRVCGQERSNAAKYLTLDEFIKRSMEVHGDRYDYSKVVYKKAVEPVIIICPEHGEFNQLPTLHMIGNGCHKCANEIRKDKNRLTTKQFIDKAMLVHGCKYDYSKVEYVDGRSKVKIICKKHGVFEQSASSHLSGCGCKVCANEAISYARMKSELTFIQEARVKHGNKCDYTGVRYKAAKTKVKIICRKHGVFEQTPSNHLKSIGCSECKKENLSVGVRRDLNYFLSKAKDIYGDRFDYSLVEYNGGDTPVTIICKKHGPFTVKPLMHYRGTGGCPECRREKIREACASTTVEFIEKAIRLHGDKYDYSLVDYTTSNDKVKIVCKKHGVFEQFPGNHLSGNGCPLCKSYTSKGEQELFDWIKSLGFSDAKKRKFKGLEIDIYIPSKKIGIEYNGLYYHTATLKGRSYHLNKTKAMNELGIRIIHIWDFEWLEKKAIVKSILRNALGKNKHVVYARNLVLDKEVDVKEAKSFCGQNHIAGYRGGAVRVGLRDKSTGDLISLMVTSDKTGELVRFCSKVNYKVIGGFSRLLKYSPVRFSYVDRRLFTAEGYIACGFEMRRETQPNYFYIKGGKYVGSRVMFQKHKLKARLETFDPNLSEWENCWNNGYDRVFDCGNFFLTIP